MRYAPAGTPWATPYEVRATMPVPREGVPGEREADPVARLLGGRVEEALEHIIEPRTPDPPEHSCDLPPVHRGRLVPQLPQQRWYRITPQNDQRGCRRVAPIRQTEVPHHVHTHKSPLRQRQPAPRPS